MSATQLVASDKSNKDRIFNYAGTGAIEATDELVTNPKKFKRAINC